jgi:choline monooxygenase
MIAMPEFEGVSDFPSAADNLPNVPHAKWGRQHFASLDPVAPLEEYYRPMIERVGWLPLSQFQPDASRGREYVMRANWALYCDNYLEGFHIPYVHHSLNVVLDYGAYTTETLRYSSVQTGYDENGNVVARYLFIFPNTMFNFYPWGISVNIVKPLTPASSRVTFLTYILDDSKLSTGAGADLHGVELEDEAVVESVQQGIRSRFYDRGRYSPSREQGTHHFHRMIAEFME